MVAKFTSNLVGFDFDAHLTGSRAPHLVYANLDFHSETLPKDARVLLKWLSWRVPLEWGDDRGRTLRYLEKHQSEFRDCLNWISEGCVTDFSAEFEAEDEETESQSRQRWEQFSPLKFFRQHTLLHSGITFKPEWQESSLLSGLQLTQREPRDPLDAICWHVLSLLVFWGAILIRRCRYWKCAKFFHPPTQRRAFCSDSCRALDHAESSRSVFEEDADIKARRKKNREYMREYRANPYVKRRASSRKH